MAGYLRRTGQTLLGLAVLCLFQALGTALVRGLTLPLPGPVVGLALLLPVLGWTGLARQRWLRDAAYGLIRLLSLLFLPAGVGLFFLGDTLGDQWPALLVAVFLATPLSVALSALVLQALLRRTGDADE